MTEIEKLIKQAKAIQKAWRHPEPDRKVLTHRTWQEILDGPQPYPSLRYGNL